MSLPATAHWQELAVLLHRTPLIAARRLRAPCPVALPPEPFLAHLLATAHQKGLADLFYRHLLTALALPSPHKSQPDQLPHAAIQALFPEHAPATLYRGHWLCLPILTCQESTSSITWFLLGSLPGEEGGLILSGHPIPERSSRVAMQTALEAVRRCCGHTGGEYLVMAVQHPDDPPVTGGSLALPFALGMLLLDRQSPWPELVFASGGLTADGDLQAIDGETVKYLHVHKRMHALILPENGLINGLQETKVLRCADLDQAFFVLSCLQDRLDPQAINWYRVCLGNPQLFLEQFHILPLPLLTSREGRSVLSRIATQRHIFLHKLSICLAGCRDDPQRSAMLADLFTPEEILAIAHQAGGDEGFHAHQWCVARITSANRRGAVAATRVWIKLADTLHPRLTEEEFVESANHGLIATRFNRYDFRPELPEDFHRALAMEEKTHPGATRNSRPLGALYGTMAQNYGFCGPQWRQHLEESVEKAAVAFGRKHHRDRLRLFAYRIYGLLDAELYGEASDLLDQYLGLTAAAGHPRHLITTLCQINQQPSEHTPFQTAVACRLLAETVGPGAPAPTVVDLQEIVNAIPAALHHPWQLTTCNLGRLALTLGAPALARQLLARALRACLQGGETMQAMALLPLAILHHHGLIEAEHTAICSRTLEMIANSPQLNQQHFRPLLQASGPDEVLAEVQRHRGRYFPFSYR
ncbi:hypothetical protein [Desulfobulbus alkaliphilus]|uniref:hypothetical protein n=1 Tax=Desulfobulbus alkaliphilus TaxID=869814 RepID=UPI0019667D64|nr:hypothetical protein [Desulfobulbus alkaliphilus]MBM9536294.1 hypothetical protein [Desulfobulbus alkaliphilus]